MPCPPGKICPSCPSAGYRSQVAGQVLDFDTAELPEGVQPDRYDRYAQLALLATKEAVADSGLRIERENPHRVGVIMGAGMGGMLIGEEEFAKVYMDKRPHRVHPNFIPMITLNSASGIIAMTFRAKGPNLTISTGVLIERSRHRALARRDPGRPGRRGHHAAGRKRASPRWPLPASAHSARCRPRTTISPRGPPAPSSARATDS